MGAEQYPPFPIARRIVLAHEQPFRVGSLEVEPARRQVKASGRSETLEPRVMQVLVALARTDGDIVTRDELLEFCWDGRIVGDDAINRVLSRIRRVAAGIGEGSFAIETIPRVGYKLNEAAGDRKPVAPVATTPIAPAFNRRILIGSALAVASLAIGGVVVSRADSPARQGSPAEAEALYNRAIAVWQEERASSNRQALAYLRRAVQLAPDYGQAWGALALAYRGALREESRERVAGFAERLQEAVLNAQLYDPGNADATAALLPIEGSFGRWSSHERIFRSAIDRHPDHPLAHAMLGNILMDVGRWADAVATLQTIKGLAPSSPLTRYKLIVSLWSAGRISAAEDEIADAMQLWPQHGAIWQTRIKILALTGKPSEALLLASDPATVPQGDEDAPNQSGRQAFLRALASRAPADVENAIGEIILQARKVELDRVTMALQATVLGRSELALDILEGVYLGVGEWALRSVGTESLSTHPLFQPHARPLWREPRFERLLAGTGLENYWRETGTQPDHRR